MRIRSLIVSLSLLAGSGPSLAETPGLSFSGGYTIIGQTADDGRPEAEATASADFYLKRSWRTGRLMVYVEGNTTPRDEGVSVVLPESNADAQTALDAEDRGRLQISELKYEWVFGDDALLGFGLVDLTAYLDTTRINNDENMQFLGTSFLNNPAIEFPDYAIGGVFHRHGSGRSPFLTFTLTGSAGLADNPDRTYSELFELTGDGKGIFFGSEAGWESEHRVLRVGAWLNSSSHEPLDGRGAEGDNYGFYTNLGLSRGRHAASLRLGASNPDVALASAFASLTYQHGWDGLVLGLGAARTWKSTDAPGPSTDVLQVEAYLRVDLRPDIFLTPSIQLIENSAYDGSDTIRPDRVYLLAIRLHQRF